MAINIRETEIGISISPEARKKWQKRITMLDVSDNPTLLELARKEVAHSYNRLARPSRNPQEVYAELCLDGYDNHGRSRTIAAFDTDPQTGDLIFVSSGRLVVGKDETYFDDLKPIDAMNLLTVPNWPHRRNQDFPAQTILGEIGRFVIAKQYRTARLREEGVPVLITSLIFGTSAKIAQELGVEFLYAIMPSYVIDLVRQAGIEYVEVMGVERDWSNPEATNLFKTYNIYWQKLDPRLYMFINFKNHDK